MPASRFFWLPWRSKHAGVVGSRTRMDMSPWDPITQTTGGPNQYGNGGLFREVNLSTAMGCYAVTQDPARVPLVQTNLYATADLNDASDYPRLPWYVWDATNCAMRSPGGSPLDHPEAGPWYWAMGLKPWAFFVYELNSAMTLRGQYFISNYNAHPWNSWFIGRCYAGTHVDLTPYGYSGQWVEALGEHGASPVGAYVLRPSTGNIVGWLYQRYLRGGAGPHAANYGSGTAQRSSPFSGPGPQNKSYFSAYQSIVGNYFWGGGGTDVVVQPGDLLVWEWWASGFLGCNSVQQYYPHPRIDTTVEITLGGGLAGQPLTLDGSNLPNWAPAWGMPHPDTPVIPGIEPIPLRPSQCSVGF